MTAPFLLACAAHLLMPAAAPSHLIAPPRTSSRLLAPVRTSSHLQTPVVHSVIVHGNHTTPTAEVLSLAGDLVGQAADDALVDGVAARLRASGRFSGVDVRRRFVSIDDPSRILLVIVVTERPGISDDDLTPGPMKRLRAGGMWSPILDYQEGYGFTYGARVSLVDQVGPRSRISAPLTWGGERQAGVEVERTFRGPAIARVIGGGGVTRRTNPHFGLADTRHGVWGRVDSAPRRWLRAGVEARLAEVAFGAADDRLSSLAGEVILDTRREPAFPRHAVWVSLGIERLGFRGDAVGGHARTSSLRRRVEGRGYLGLPGQSVVAVRVQSIVATSPVPAFEWQLLGGIPSLRGTDVGGAAGDNLAAASIEWRQPIGSPRNLARFGVKGFVDAGVAYASGQALSDQRFQRGHGGGLFLQATVFTLDVDLGWRPGRSRPNAHVQFGLRLSR